MLLNYNIQDILKKSSGFLKNVECRMMNVELLAGYLLIFHIFK